MNERIKALVEKTYFYDTYENVKGEQQKVYAFTKNGVQELADLIVRECAQVARLADAAPGAAIEKHFGVEE